MATAHARAWGTEFGLQARWHGKRITPTVDQLFVRSAPGTNYHIIDTIKRGEVYAVMDKPNEFWFKIDFKGQPGFVYASSVTFAP